MPFVRAWCGVKLPGVEKKMWITLFYVTIWTIWSIRNKIVFKNANPDWEWEKRQIKVKWAF